MKKLGTMICCLCLAVFGAVVGLNNKSPAVTANAAPVFELPLDLKLPYVKHDTIYISRDTIMPCNKNHYEFKEKVVRIPYAVRDTLYVPVLTTIILEDRKESSSDSTKCVSVANDSTQIQKPLDIPDSVSVRPVECIK